MRALNTYNPQSYFRYKYPKNIALNSLIQQPPLRNSDQKLQSMKALWAGAPHAHLQLPKTLYAEISNKESNEYTKHALDDFIGNAHSCITAYPAQTIY